MKIQSAIPKVKICGITNLEDAMLAVELDADAIGFVFAPSKRQIKPEIAQAIIQQLPTFTITVGVFMDMPIHAVAGIATFTGIDRLQLHGKESPEMCAQLGHPVIKRIPINADDTAESLHAKMDAFRVSGFVLDPGAGHGHTFNWELAKGIDRPYLLAGGLTPDNVRSAIDLLKPYGVDVASGVEAEAGRKDPEKLKRFIKEVKCP